MSVDLKATTLPQIEIRATQPCILLPLILFRNIQTFAQKKNIQVDV